MARTFKEFVEEHRIGIQCMPDSWSADDTEWDRHARHWRCTLNLGQDSRATFRFHQGSAHKDLPTAEDLLYCLASDASGADQTIKEWASDFGYTLTGNEGNRTRGIYKLIQENSRRLKIMIGSKRYAELLQCEEE